jgi:hypothetical protein
VTGEVEGGGGGSETEDSRWPCNNIRNEADIYIASQVFMKGEEGVDMRMPLDFTPQDTSQDFHEHFSVPTPLAGYDFDRRGFVLQQEYSFDPFPGAEGLGLERTNSNDSLAMHMHSGSEPSVASIGINSACSENPSLMIAGVGTWSSDTRSGYFFIVNPLPLVPTVRCACHTGTYTENSDNSSTTLYTDESDISEDGVDAESVN